MGTSPKGGQNMNVIVERKFAVEVVYNGVVKPLEVEPEEKVSTLLQRAIQVFRITQNAHLLSLFRQDGSVVPENESLERAGVKPCETLLLRPNVVKGGAECLRLEGDIIGESFRWFRECGRGECECVVYWTGPAGQRLVDGVEHPIHPRSPFGYEVQDRWLTDFWRRLGASNRSVRAQVHTHPGEAFHSATDDRWAIVSQAGFVSIVIPNFGSGKPSLEDAWVGRLDGDGVWRAEISFEALITP
jgi:hypothetical protein